MRSDVVQAIGDLIRSGNAETDRPSYTVPGFQTDDIYPIIKKYLNTDAQVALDTKALGMIHQRNILIAQMGFVVLLKKLGLKSCKDWYDGDLYKREFDRVRFCVSRSDKATIPKAVDKVVAAINDLASRGYITAALLPMSVMVLNRHENFEPEYTVLSYIALTTEGSDYVKNNMPKMFVDEGEMPERFENQ